MTWWARSGCPADGRGQPDGPDHGTVAAPGSAARIVEHVRVIDVVCADGRVTGVRTDASDIDAGSRCELRRAAVGQDPSARWPESTFHSLR